MNSGIVAVVDPDRACGRRPTRVVVLLMGVIVLSLADLIVTLAHLKTIGMIEANPIAAFLIRATQSAWALIAFKALSVGVCATLLYRLRRHLACEVAAWCAVGILAVMCFMWHHYSSELESPARVMLAQSDESWQYLD